MSDTAFQTQYRQEYIASFEQHQSLLRETVTTEAVIKGNKAIFLVAGSGNSEAKSRGVNGLIPARADDNTQNTCTLYEWHDLVRKTDFNVFASQGNQRAIMQMSTMAVMNRKMDSVIIDELGNTTTTAGGAGQVPNVMLFQKARVKLTNADVPWDGNITLACQPSFIAYLELAPEFSNAKYVDLRPFAGDEMSWRDKPQVYRWRNCVIMEHPNLPGKETSSEISFMYHKNAIGHAVNTAGMESPVGYDEEQGYSWARVSADMGAKLLQTTGVIKITHDGSEFA